MPDDKLMIMVPVFSPPPVTDTLTPNLYPVKTGNAPDNKPDNTFPTTNGVVIGIVKENGVVVNVGDVEFGATNNSTKIADPVKSTGVVTNIDAVKFTIVPSAGSENAYALTNDDETGEPNIDGSVVLEPYPAAPALVDVPPANVNANGVVPDETGIIVPILAPVGPI
jgi:hypothetical protein